MLHQNKLPIIGDGQDRNDPARFATLDVLPAIVLFNPEKVTFE